MVKTTQLLGEMFNPTFWELSQSLGQNNTIAGFVHILYLTFG